jgi:uncharacterized protein with NRDE domain
MCLVSIWWKSHPEYPLIISANRDEFFDRPTMPIHCWESGFYAGKDLRGGGTWLGFHPNGRWSLLTNYRDFISQRTAKISRGKLVQEFLESDISPYSYLEQIEKNKNLYNGFNLLVSDGQELFYYSNYGEKTQKIRAGIHGLSNGLINDHWPKAELAKQQLQALNTSEFSTDTLLSILKSDHTFPLKTLPCTGIPDEMERALSSQFIRMNDNYGTVSSTAVLVDSSGFTQLKERTFNWDYHHFTDQAFQFDLNNPIQTK